MSNRSGAWPIRALATAVATGSLALAACGPTKFEAELNVPPPLVSKIPIAIGVYLPEEFRTRVYEEKRRDYAVSVAIGKAQTDGFNRLMSAMFDRAIAVSSTSAAAFADPDMRAIFEPVLEDYSFITPRDSNAPIYAVSVKYRINGYNRQGQIFESWTFTGYGSVESSTMGLKGTNALKAATGLAMRDAAAKLAAEFREQAIVRGLLPANAPLAPVLPPGSPAPAAAATPSPAAGETPTQPAPESAPTATPGSSTSEPATGGEREQPPAGESPPAGDKPPASDKPPPSDKPPAGDSPPSQPLKEAEPEDSDLATA
jgi:hypothetical protein